ncbi:hypothetical protein OAO87_03460 [bacterium]|nr:hypothetical protein [bacterium]
MLQRPRHTRAAPLDAQPSRRAPQPPRVSPSAPDLAPFAAAASFATSCRHGKHVGSGPL